MIQVGSQKIKDIYVGNQKIKEVYHGSQLIYSSGPPRVDSPEAVVMEFIQDGGSSQYAPELTQFVKNLQSSGLWDRMIAIYPMIGNTFNSLKLNLKVDGTGERISQFDLYSIPGWGTATMGVNSIIANGVLSTNIWASDVYGMDDTSFHIMNITNSDVYTPDIASRDYYYHGTEMNTINIYLKRQYYASAMLYSNFEEVQVYNEDAIGFYTISKTVPSYTSIYKNGELLATSNEPLNSYFGEDVLLGGDDPASSTGRTYTFFAVGRALNNDTQFELMEKCVRIFRNSL